jgi:membrane protein
MASPLRHRTHEDEPAFRSALARRFEAWARRRRMRIREVNPFLVVVRASRRFSSVRVPGLSAEMSYYALISLIPFLIAVGASFGMLERVIGAAQIHEVENTVVRGLQQVFSPELTADVLEPLVRSLLEQERTGVALLSLLVTFFLASAVFRAMIRALDDAYQVPERRRGIYLWMMAYLFALGSIVVLTSVLSLIVVGPLMGGGARLASVVGLGRAFEVLWALGRWPVVFAIAVAYFGWVFRVAPNVENGWRHSLPGAVVSTVAIIVISAGLRVYLDALGPRAPTVAPDEEALAIVSQTIGTLLAVILWLWLIGMAVISGGLINAEIRREITRRRRRQGPRLVASMRALARRRRRRSQS